MSDKVTIKWNHENHWFEAFMPDGSKIPKCLEISIKDNYGKESAGKSGLMTATITLMVKLDSTND